MSMIEGLHQEFLYEAAQTAKLLERVPEDKFDWQPHPKSMTLGRLAGHIAEIPVWAISILTTDGMDFAKESYQPLIPKTLDELLAAHKKNTDTAAALMQDKDDAYLMKHWSLRAGEKVYFDMPRIAVLRGMIIKHAVHHRGQLTVYLRLNDIPLPALIGPSADDAGE